MRGWWGYYQLAENRRPIFRLGGWIRRHIRKCFRLQWHQPEGRERRLRSLGLRGRRLKVAKSFPEAWHLAGAGVSKPRHHTPALAAMASSCQRIQREL